MGVSLPATVACWIVFVSASGFAIGVRGLKGWYQGLVAFFTVLALAGLLLTNKLDPGAVTPVLEIGRGIIAAPAYSDESVLRGNGQRAWDKCEHSRF